MRLAVAVLFLCGVMQAQAPAWLCKDDTKAALKDIYKMTDEDEQEHGFRVDPDGVHTTFGASVANDSKGDQVVITMTKGVTLAVVHTHPKERLQDPSIKDRAIAKKYGIPVVVVGMGSQEIKAAMPDGSVVWWSFVWHGDASACRVKNAKR